MGRRYLVFSEVASALRRGKTVECFLGACERDGIAGIRRIALDLLGEAVRLDVYISADLGTSDFLDLYEFRRLDDSLELDEPDETHTFASLEECLAIVEGRWPGSTQRLVNEGVVQEEYRDYLTAIGR